MRGVYSCRPAFQARASDPIGAGTQQAELRPGAYQLDRLRDLMAEHRQRADAGAILLLDAVGEDVFEQVVVSMWRAFGDFNVARVALVIKVPHYSEGQDALNVIFSPVAYLDEKG